MPTTAKSLETISIEEAFEVLNSNNGLVKTVWSPLNENQAWDKIIPQLADPKHNRPVKKIDENEIDRSRAYHPKLNLWETKIIKALRGSPKETIFTKKTPTTLLPIDGKIHLFKPTLQKHQDTVGMLFDLRQCDLNNEKYIFPTNVVSNKKWWLKRKKLAEAEHPIVKGISLDQLKKILSENRENGITPQHNELLAGLSKEALVGLFATKNELFARLNTLAKQHSIKKQLHKVVPLFIITPEEGIVIYDEKQQLRDLQLVLSRNANEPLRKMAEKEIDPNLLAKALHSLPTNQHILTHEHMPNEIKYKVLGYLTFKELANHISGLNQNTEQQQELKNLVLEKFKEDFNNLCTELNKPLTKSNLKTMLTTELHNSSQLERAVIHFCHRNSHEVEDVLAYYLTQNKNPNLELVLTVLHFSPKMDITKYRKSIVSIEQESGPWHYSPAVEVELFGWSVLVGAALHAKNDISKLIIEKYPNHLTDVMNALTQLEKICRDYPSDAIYSLQQVTNTKASLLLQLKPEHHHYYQLTYEDKRLIQQELTCDIHKLTQKSDIENFYTKMNSMLCFNQRRHAHYDNLTNKKFSKLQKNVLKKLQQQSFSIPHDDRKPMNEDEKNLITSLSLELKSLLETKREQIEKEKNSFKSLFYFSSNTYQKDLYLQHFLLELNKVVTLTDLRLFTENLLTNKYIVDSRTLLSFTKSDTYTTLNNFYQHHFTKKM